MIAKNKLSLPRTPEEYTIWALEFSDGFFSWAKPMLEYNANGSAVAVLRWIEYTLREYPEYLTIDVYATYFNVWVCGVFVQRYQSHIEIEMIRNIIDCDRCEKRKGRARKQVKI